MTTYSWLRRYSANKPPREVEKNVRKERITAVTVHKRLPLPVAAIVDRLSTMGVANLWISSPDGFLEGQEIPLLGTGKVELKWVK